MTDRGCFALPSVHNHQSVVCKTCPARVECRDKAHGFLKRISGALNVDALLQSYQIAYAVPDAPVNRTLTLAERTTIASMPGRVGARLERLLLQSFDHVAASSFAQGENPFPERGARHLLLTGDLLLRGGFDKATLREAFIKQFGWEGSTASSEVSNTIALLRGLGIAREKGGWISLTPKV